jgi:hypothetical protein
VTASAALIGIPMRVPVTDYTGPLYK